MRSALLEILFQEDCVRTPYIDLIQSVVSTEFEISNTYVFFDGNIRREGIAYILGGKEVYWLQAVANKPAALIIRDQSLRENILDLLAVHPLYTKWFDLE